MSSITDVVQSQSAIAAARISDIPQDAFVNDDRDFHSLTVQDRVARESRDLALLDRIRAGDAKALDELARYYVVQLSAVASAVLKSSGLAEDAVQDVILAIWERRETLEVRSSVAGYLHRATYNRAANLARHERSQQRRKDRAADLDVDLPRVAQNDAELRLEEADLDRRLHAALRLIPPSPREVFLLSWQGGLTYEEIAHLLEITPRSVGKQMYRATQRLAAYFSRHER